MKTQNLEVAKRYKVVHKKGDKTITATRIFKWPEKRFGSILCFVFTSRVNRNVTASFADNKLTITGKRIPRQEISIPIYDLCSFELLP